jgi:5-methyltetrahydrofolate--homocysteine methyltransferase
VAPFVFCGVPGAARFAEVIMIQADRTAELSALLEQRLLVLDGAMGTMIQRHGLQRSRLPRRALQADHPHDLKGNNDLLVC